MPSEFKDYIGLLLKQTISSHVTGSCSNLSKIKCVVLVPQRTFDYQSPLKRSMSCSFLSRQYIISSLQGKIELFGASREFRATSGRKSKWILVVLSNSNSSCSPVQSCPASGQGLLYVPRLTRFSETHICTYFLPPNI